MRSIQYLLLGVIVCHPAFAEEFISDTQATCVAGLVAAKAEAVNDKRLKPGYFHTTVGRVMQEGIVLLLQGEIPTFPPAKLDNSPTSVYLSYCAAFGIPPSEIRLVQKVISHQLPKPVESLVRCNAAIEANLPILEEKIGARQANAVMVGLYEKMKQQLAVLDSLLAGPVPQVSGVNQQADKLLAAAQQNGADYYRKEITSFNRDCKSIGVPLEEVLEVTFH